MNTPPLMPTPRDDEVVPLTQLLSQGRLDLETREPPLWVHAHLRAKLHQEGVSTSGGASVQGRKRAARFGPLGAAVLTWVGSLAGAALLVAGVLVWVAAPTNSGGAGSGGGVWPARGGMQAAALTVRADSGFMPVVSAERWSQVALDLDNPAGAAPQARRPTSAGTASPANTGTAWVVRTELPAPQLAAMGLPFDPARAAEPVQAELLLHASGEVLAVRVWR